METKHISISKKSNESLSAFLSRMTTEIRALESDKATIISDITFSFPDDAEAKEDTTVTIYYDSQQGEYHMDKVEFRSSGKSSNDAVLEAHKLFTDWLLNSPGADIYDIKTDLYLNEKGDDVARVSAYFDKL